MTGFGWTGRFSWPVAYTALFVVAIAYAIAFVLLNGKFSWLISGVACGIIQILILLPTLFRYGTDWQSIAVLFVEWFAVGGIAGLLAMLVSTDRSDKPKRQTNYY